HETEDEPEDAHPESHDEQRAPVDAEDRHLPEVGHDQARLATSGLRGERSRRQQHDAQNQQRDAGDDRALGCGPSAKTAQTPAPVTHASLAPCLDGGIPSSTFSRDDSSRALYATGPRVSTKSRLWPQIA